MSESKEWRKLHDAQKILLLLKPQIEQICQILKTQSPSSFESTDRTNMPNPKNSQEKKLNHPEIHYTRKSIKP